MTQHCGEYSQGPGSTVCMLDRGHAGAHVGTLHGNRYEWPEHTARAALDAACELIARETAREVADWIESLDSPMGAGEQAVRALIVAKLRNGTWRST